MRSTGAITNRRQQERSGGVSQDLVLTTTQTPKPMDGTGSRWTPAASQKGLAFWMQTNSNGKTSARWFDIGAEGGKTDGEMMEAQARSCWLRDVWRVVPVQLA